MHVFATRSDKRLLGRIKLDIDAARSVIDEKIAKPLGLNLMEVASSIVEVATENKTSMVASWKLSGKPANYPATNAEILDTVLEVFSMIYSRSVQGSLYRMGEAALAAAPEIAEISLACPNMHFILMNLSAFGLDNNNDVFLPTDEPHGQIECTVGRG